MAERRMFAKTIIDSDAFLDMPISSQNLYFHLSMRADDDGFLNNPKKIQRMVNASDDDLKILCAKSFLIPFETGVVVIKHWRISNYLRADRYKPTVYQEEYGQLEIKENGAYTKITGIPCGIPVDTQRETQVRLGKDSIGKDSKEESQDKHASPSKSKRIKKEFVPPTIEEVTEYVLEKQLVINPYKFIDWYSKTNWKDNEGKQIKNWKMKAISWDSREKEKNPSAIPYSKPLPLQDKVPREKKKCPKCGGDIRGSACVLCYTNYDYEGNEI